MFINVGGNLVTRRHPKGILVCLKLLPRRVVPRGPWMHRKPVEPPLSYLRLSAVCYPLPYFRYECPNYRKNPCFGNITYEKAWKDISFLICSTHLCICLRTWDMAYSVFLCLLLLRRCVSSQDIFFLIICLAKGASLASWFICIRWKRANYSCIVSPIVFSLF